MKMKIRKIIRQIRKQEFGGQREISFFMKPDPGAAGQHGHRFVCGEKKRDLESYNVVFVCTL